MRHLLSIDDLGGRDGLEEVHRLTDSFVEVSQRNIPKVPTLRGKTVVSLFYEDSTRTRLSFDTAAKRLSADTMTFSVSSSSVNKGESLRDTVQTIEAMGVDAIVVRHGSAGVPNQVASWVDAAVINAGDGWHEHPTQALLDCYTIRQRLGSLDGRHIAIIGDIKHSRVARSNVLAFTALGAEVTLVAPPTLLPPSLEGWPVRVSHDLDAVLPSLDVAYLLRMQRERMTEALLPSLREYTETYGLTLPRADRAAARRCRWSCTPGPMNRGVEIAAEVADRPNSAIVDQVRNGVAVRMAVLFLLLGPGRAAGGPRARGATPARGGRRRQRVDGRHRSRSVPVAELVIKGGQVVDRDGSRRADVAIADGRVVEVGADIAAAGATGCSTPGGCVVAPAWSTCTPTCGSRARRRRRRSRPAAAALRSAGTPRWWPCPTRSPPSTAQRWSARSANSGARPSATCSPPVPSRSAGQGSAWRRWPRWPRWVCACSPTTAPGSRTTASCAGPWSTPPACRSRSCWPSTARTTPSAAAAR